VKPGHRILVDPTGEAVSHHQVCASTQTINKKIQS
jgi:hypothetical protein